VGPVPHWGKALPAEVVRFMQSKNSPNVPERMKMPNELEESIKEIGKNLSLLSKRDSVHYVASYESFCDLGGCLVTLNRDGIKNLTAFDDAHLTPIAAQFLVTKNKNVFFPERTNGLAISR